MSLNELLQRALEHSNAKLPQQALEIIEAAQVEMRQFGLGIKACGVGDYLADISLKNATGEDVAISTLNEDGPLIVTFYRRCWCPYCNLELTDDGNRVAKAMGIAFELPVPLRNLFRGIVTQGWLWGSAVHIAFILFTMNLLPFRCARTTAVQPWYLLV